MRKKQKRNRTTCVLAVTAALACLITACGGGGDKKPQKTEDGRDKVVIWTDANCDTIVDWEDNAILQAVEDATDTSIEIEAINSDNKMDLLNASIASGTLPDILPIVGPENRGVLEGWIQDGVLASYEGEVAEAAPLVLEEYEKNPYLAELKVDGKIYLQPGYWGFETYPNGGLIYVREDLCEKFGLALPNTFDEYFTYLETCCDNGYDGVIFSGENGISNALSAFVGAYGTPNLGWVKTDDGYQYWALQEGALEGLQLFREMNARGLINPSAWEADDDINRSAFVSGEACSTIFWGGGHIGRIQNDMSLVNEEFQCYLLPALDAGTGNRGYTSEGMYSGYGSIGGMEHNNPAAAARVVNFLLSEEGVKLTVLGIEGRDYEEKDGEYVLNIEQRTEDGFPTESGETGAHPLATNLVSWVPQEWQNWQLLYGKGEDFENWFDSQWENQGKYTIDSCGQAVSTPSWASFQTTSNELVSRYFNDIVKCDSEESAEKLFEEFVTSWYSSGGETAEEEMSELLTELYG